MDGRHDYSSLDRGRLFHHPHPGHPGHPPGPTPPPPPLLSPVGFPETGGGLGSGLARQSLVELARVNAATPGGPLGPPLPGGPAGYSRTYHMPGSLSLHSPRSGYQSSLMSPFLSGGAGAGAGGSGAGGGAGGSGAGPSSTSVGAGPSPEAAAAYKSMLSASTPGLPPHYWPPPPPSPHTTPPTEGLGRHSLTGSLYPGYMSLLPGADNMALYSAASSSPMSQSMHAYHRIYDLHKEAYMPGVPGLGTTSSSVPSVTDNPLFAYPHTSCSAACFTSGCSRVSSMSATLELQEQARALHFHLQQQHIHAKLQEEQERGDWEWHREREREREEREREERGREERDREERDRERVGREREREKEKERERDDRERENREKQRERESPTTRPRSSSDGASSRRHKRSPPGVKTVKTESGGTVTVEKDPHRHHSPHSHHPHQQHGKESDNDQTQTSPDSPSKSKDVLTSHVAEVSGLPRQQAASPGEGTLEEKDDIASNKAKARGKVSDKGAGDKDKDAKGSNSEGVGETVITSDSIQRLDSAVQHRDDASSLVPHTQQSKGTGGVADKETPHVSDTVAVDKVKMEPHQQQAAVVDGDKVTTSQQQPREKEHLNVIDLKSKKSEAIKCHAEEFEGQSSTVLEAGRTTQQHPQTSSVGATPSVQQPSTPSSLHQKVTEQNKPNTTSTVSPSSSTTAVTTTSSTASSAVSKPSLRSTPQSLVCLKKQLTENIPSDILGGNRSQRLESLTSSTVKTTSRHDPPRPVLTSALQATRRLLHSPEGVVTTSSMAVVTSPMVTATTSLAQSHRHAVTTTTTSMTVPKMTSNVGVVTSSGAEGSMYTVCSSTKSTSMMCVPTGVNVSSGESSSGVTRVSSSHRALGTLYSYSHVSGNGMPETGPRKVHATTFTPEVGTVHHGPITSPVSSNNNSNSSNSSTASTSPIHGGDHKRATGERGQSKTQHMDSTPQDGGRSSGRPCLTTAADAIIKSGQAPSVPQHLQTMKQRLGHGKKKEENKSLCRLQQTQSGHTPTPSVLSKGPLSSALNSGGDKDLRMRLGHIDHVANSERTEHGHEHGKPDKTGSTSNSEEVNAKSSDHHRMHHSKGHLGTLQRLAGSGATKDDQWHGHWASSRDLPHTGLHTPSGDGVSVDAHVIGSIVPKEEAIEEESTSSNKQISSSSASRKRQGDQHHHHGAASSHKWTSLGGQPGGAGDPSTKGGYGGSLSKQHKGILSPGGSAEPQEHSGGMSHPVLDPVVKEEGSSDTPISGRGLERAAHGRRGVEGVGSQLHQHQHHEQHHQSTDPYMPHHRQHPPAQYLLSPIMSAAEGAVLPPGGHVGRTRPARSGPHEQVPHSTANDVKPVLVGDTHSTRLVPVTPQRHPVPEVKEGSQNEDTPATSGSNIPVGIAIARKRGDKRHTQAKSDEGGPTNTEAASERVRHREGADAEPSRGPARDNTNTTSKPSTDIGPNLVVTGGGSRTWREGEEPSPGPATHSGVGAWLPPGAHPQLGPAMWLGQGGFPIPSTVDPAQLTVPPPGGLKLAQDPLTGQVYAIPDVPLEAGRVWPASGFAPGSLQGQQLQFLQQQYVQQLQHLQQQQQQQQPKGGPPGAARPPEAVKTEAPCRQEEQAGGPHYQQLQRQPKSDTAANMGSGSSEASRASRSHFKTSPAAQAPPGDSAENQGATSGPLLPPGEAGQNQGGPHPFLVGLGQTFPGLPYPPHLPYYLDPALLQQLRTGTAPPPHPPAVSTETTPTSRAEPVTVMSRGCSPIVFPPDVDVDDEVANTSQAITTVSTACGPSEAPTRSTIGSQTSRSPVLELLRMYSKEEGTQTSSSELPELQPATSKVEVGVQLTPPIDSDSDSNCALTMPHLTARTIDCGTQADDADRGGMTYSTRYMSSGHYYDSDRRSASPPPPALVAEGSPRHLSDTAAPPNLIEQRMYSSDNEGPFNMSSSALAGGFSSVSSSCLNTPTPRAKGIFDLDLEFLNRQILEASDGLELLSTLAERAQREQQERSAPGTAEEDEDEDDGDSDDTVEGRQPGDVITDTDDDIDVETDINRNNNDDVETDINRNYNAPKASMFMEGPSMYSFSSKFASPTSKKDVSRLSSTFSYTEEQVDASQIEMRMKLNDLQRKYKEKQRQLAKLQPRREEERHLIKRGPGRPRKRRFKKSSSKSESPSKSPRSESSERIPSSAAIEQQSPKKKKKDSSSCSKSSPFSITSSKSKSKSSGSSSKRVDGSSSRSDKSSSKKKSSLGGGSSSGSKSSKSGSSKNKSSSSGSKSQSKKKDGKSSQKKTKVKKEERDLDLEDSELEDVSWLFDEDEINPPPTVFAPTPVKKPAAKPTTQPESIRSQQPSATSSHERHGADHHMSPVATSHAAASRSPYSFTESYDETSDEGSLGLLARFASNDWRCSVAAATSAALKSKKRKKRPGDSYISGFGDLNDAPVKKRKPGRPKKFEHELETGMTETIVDKKSKSLSLLHINTNTTTSSSGAISSSSSSSSSSSGSSLAGPSQPADANPKKKVKTNNKEQKPAKNDTGVPFLEEEWCLRRSERIFLSDPNLNSPPLPTDTADKSLSQKKLDTDSSGSASTTPSLTTSTKIVRPAKTPTPVTTASVASTATPVTSSTTASSDVGGSGSGAALKAKSSSKLKAKVKTVHDLSQKVKKKYKKPLKPSLVKAMQQTIKSEPSSTPSTVNQTATTNLKPALSSSKTNSSSSKVNSNSSKATGSSSKVTGGSSKVTGSTSKNSASNPKVKYDQVYTDSDSDSETSSDGDNVPLSAYIERSTTPEPRSCVISKDDLRGGLRVLIYMEGLFYEGQVRAIEPPDVYGVVIDGERGSRPHILSQEELLNEAVLDVQPASTRCLVEGTRVCAYWSQQFSCLYPGTVAKSSPNPATDKHLVSVEFDDGDSGRIPIEHIRMLPHDYPVVTVGPSPILVLSKRRRRTASEELMTDGRDRKLPAQPTEPSTTFQSPDEPKQRRRFGKNLGIRRQDEDQGLLTISETSLKQPPLDPIDEYDPLREFGPDIPPKVPLEQSKEKEVTKDAPSSISLPPPQSTSTSGKKKHKHKEKKKERDKERAAKRSSSSGGADDHKHKHHHHHHHHHHHKKHKHRKSSTDSAGGSSSKSAPTTPLVGASTVKGSFLSQTPAATAEATASVTTTSNNSAETAPSLGPSHKTMSELSINTTSSGNMMVTATSPGNNGDKKLTMRIRTNSTDTHPLSPKHGVTGDSSHTQTKAGDKTASGSSTEKSQSEHTARSYQVADNYSEDDSPDTSSEDDDDDDSDFLDSKGSSKKKQKSTFLPARQLWRWLGTSTRRPGMKGKAKKEYYKAITRGKEVIRVGDCAVFLSTGRPHLPYVGRIESLWEAWGGNMVVKVKWFYHPEETKGGKKILEIKGALYQSPHGDENDVQTISHKCEVMSYTDYKARSTGGRRHTDYDNEDVYYLAGTYEPTVGMITLENDVKLSTDAKS